MNAGLFCRSSSMMDMSARQHGNLLAERGFGLMELFNLGGGVAEIAGQQAGQRVALAQVGLQDPLLVLEQDGAAGVLKDGVAEVVAELDFARISASRSSLVSLASQ